MSTYGYLAHHGVKGQKWGIRKQVPTSGRTRASVRPSPDKRKAIAIAAVSTLAAASLIGGGVAVAKNPQAVTKALGSIGKAFAKTATKGDIWKGTAKQSARAMKKHFRREAIKSIPKKAGNIAKNTAKGVWGGLKDGAKEFANEKNIRQTVKSSTLRGANTALGALICGSIGLGVKSAISGQTPNRQEVTSYLTTNPNKKKK